MSASYQPLIFINSMKVIVTGATGFVGRHVVDRLLEHNHSVTAVARDPERARSLSWYSRANFVQADLKKLNANVRNHLGDADLVVHLAWSGLPNFNSLIHIDQNLPESYEFLRAVVREGYQRILVVGTCFEYGMQQGCLSESLRTYPSNPYGLAKDSLRKFLECLRAEFPFELQWCRLFYMFGDGQNPKSLLSQLDAAIRRNDKTFPMSGGEQLRDFLPIQEIARRLVRLMEIPQATGVFNICSGKPISIRSLVEERIHAAGSTIQPQLFAYPYPDYEPFAFWGDSLKFDSIDSK